MDSNEIAWGIVKGAFLLLIIIGILSSIGSFFAFIGENVLASIVIGALIVVAVLIYNYPVILVYAFGIGVITFVLFFMFTYLDKRYAPLRKIKRVFQSRKDEQDNDSSRYINDVPNNFLNRNLDDWERKNIEPGYYCYQCTKKLGLTAWSNSGFEYCDKCHDALVKN